MREFLSQWIQRHQAGEITQAIDFYQEYLISHPDDINVLQLLGIGFCQLNQFTQALETFEHARKIDPDHPAINNNIGHIFIKQKQFQQGLDYFHLILNNQPTHLGALYNLGLLHYHQKDFTTAESFFYQAAQWHDSNSDVFFNLGLCQFYQNQMKNAKRNFKCASKIATNDTRILLKLGECALQLKQHDEAQIYFEEALSIKPSFAVYHGLGCAHLGQDRMDDALKYFNEAYDLEPFNFENCHNIASIHFHKRELLEALQCWFQCLQMKPDALETLYNIGVVYQYQNKFSDAKDYFFKVLNVEPNHHDALFNLGTLALKQNKPKEAITYYQQVIKINPNNEDVRFLLTALGEETADTFNQCPKHYVSQLFNDYAPNYDQHLTQVLRYDGHKQLHALIEDTLEPKKNQWSCITDLGCGTGLAGPLLAPWTNQLIGVDCADEMLKIAHKSNDYQQLIHGYIPDFNWPNEVDLFFLADCAPYIGDLTEVTKHMQETLKPEGFIALSIEKSKTDNAFQLTPSGRYQHNRTALVDLMSQHGFSLVISKETHLRYEQHNPVTSELFIFKNGSIN